MKKPSHWILIFFGLAWIAATVFGYFRASATRGWPSAVGTVLALDYEESRLSFYRKTTGADGSTGPKFSVPMRYGYVVDGEQYVGKFFRINAVGKGVLLSGSRTWLEDQLMVGHVYRPGNQVTVYYDPARPQRALLEKGYRGESPSFYLFVGLTIIGFGIVQMLEGSSPPPS